LPVGKPTRQEKRGEAEGTIYLRHAKVEKKESGRREKGKGPFRLGVSLTKPRVEITFIKGAKKLER